MSWVRISGRVAAAAFAGLALAGTALAGPIVVKAQGPSAKLYPPGKQLADNARLTLKAGDQLVILDGRGTRTVNGPGTFSASSASAQAGVSTTAMRILSTQTSQERRGGAVRGPGIAAAKATRSPNLWFVDVTKPGTVCVADPAAVKLWRGDAEAAAELQISGSGGNGAVAMARGATTAAWPAALPVADGAEYSLAAAPGATPTVIKFALLGPNPQGLEETAAKLIERGCTAQLDMLVETVALPTEGGDS